MDRAYKMNRAYKNDKTLALAKERDFYPVVPPKKNRKFLWLYGKQLYKPRNNIKRYFLPLKRFRKVFTRYDKLDFIFIFAIYLAFIFNSLLCEHNLIYFWHYTIKNSFLPS